MHDRQLERVSVFDCAIISADARSAHMVSHHPQQCRDVSACGSSHLLGMITCGALC